MITKTGLHAVRAMVALARLPQGAHAGATSIAKDIGAPQNYLGKLLQTLAETGADVMIGSRFVDGAGYLASWHRAIGIQLFARTVSLMTGQRFTDTTSGFQVHNRAALSFLADHLPTDYPEIEGFILLKKNGFKVREVGVTMLPRRAGSSSITAVHSMYYIFKVYIAILVEMLRKPVRSGDE